MDRILKFKREKQSGDLYELIKANNFVYIWGKTGTGKTHAVKKAYPQCIEIDSSILKSKQGTIDFLQRLKTSAEAILIDDYESVEDLIGMREIDGPVSRGPLIIVGHNEGCSVGKPHVYKFPQMPPNEIEKLVKCPESARAAIDCDGDIRYFINLCLYGSSKKDDFMSAKQVIHSLIHVDGTRNPVSLIGEFLDEHGNMLGMIQENYVHSPTADPVLVSEALSLADIIDSKIYEGSWDSMCYFYNQGILLPAYHIGHSLQEIRTASIWTKSLNIRMREKKIREINNKNMHVSMDHDFLVMIRNYCNEDLDKARELILEYHIESHDLDVINHLGKIKTRHLNILKKECRERMSPKK